MDGEKTAPTGFSHGHDTKPPHSFSKGSLHLLTYLYLQMTWFKQKGNGREHGESEEGTIWTKIPGLQVDRVPHGSSPYS